MGKSLAEQKADLKEQRAQAWQAALTAHAGEGVNVNDLDEEPRLFALFKAERDPEVRRLDGELKALHARMQEG